MCGRSSSPAMSSSQVSEPSSAVVLAPNASAAPPASRVPSSRLSRKPGSKPCCRSGSSSSLQHWLGSCIDYGSGTQQCCQEGCNMASCMRMSALDVWATAGKIEPVYAHLCTASTALTAADPAARHAQLRWCPHVRTAAAAACQLLCLRQGL